MKKLDKTNINKVVIEKVLKACRLAQKHHDTHNVYVTNRKGENFLRVKRVKVGDRVMFQILDKSNHNISFLLAERAIDLRLHRLFTFFNRYAATDMEIQGGKPYAP